MFKPSPQAEEVLEKRYYQPGEDWKKMCHRIAELGADTPEEIRFFQTMYRGLFLPNTPCLVNAGKKDGGQLSACFVLPVGDSIPEIFDGVKNTALVHKTGGGTGFNFSSLRPEGSTVGTTGGVSSGPISFMKVYDAATQQMKQGGVRRGANMGILNIDHPDIIKFIKCKHVDREISNFNISVAITDDFMKVLNEDPTSVWYCHFGNNEYTISKEDDTPTLQPIYVGGNITAYEERLRAKRYNVQDIWNLICEQAWQNGEPGIIFIDEIRRKNGENINATNPCGEQPLEDYEACCLGSIDVSKLIVQGQAIDHIEINWTKLISVVHTAVDMLNRMIDASEYPLPEITEKVLQTRKIGLGIMGWADMLLKLKIRYGSEESLKLAEKLMETITAAARERSVGMRYMNQTVTTIAPTGSISIIAGCSSGIEPIYRWVTTHNREDFETVTIAHPMTTPYLEYEDEEHKLTGAPDYFVTANEITLEEHVNMQAAFQKHVDNAVSKTINMPASATKFQVDQAFRRAYHLKCKGVTVYRDESRRDQVLTREKCEGDNDVSYDDENRTLTWEEYTEQMGLPESRPYCVEGYIFKMPMEMADGKIENAYIVVGTPDGQPYEVFVNGNIREADPIAAEYIDTTTRLVSLALRGGIPLEKVVEQLEKVPYRHMFSISHKIAQALKEFLAPDLHPPCPECGEQRIYAEGCEKCSSCGWAKCG